MRPQDKFLMGSRLRCVCGPKQDVFNETSGQYPELFAATKKTANLDEKSGRLQLRFILTTKLCVLNDTSGQIPARFVATKNQYF